MPRTLAIAYLREWCVLSRGGRTVRIRCSPRESSRSSSRSRTGTHLQRPPFALTSVSAPLGRIARPSCGNSTLRRARRPSHWYGTQSAISSLQPDRARYLARRNIVDPVPASGPNIRIRLMRSWPPPIGARISTTYRGSVGPERALENDTGPGRLAGPARAGRIAAGCFFSEERVGAASQLVALCVQLGSRQM